MPRKVRAVDSRYKVKWFIWLYPKTRINLIPLLWFIWGDLSLKLLKCVWMLSCLTPIPRLLGCVPLSQSKSRICDRKFDFLFHWRANQSKIPMRTIYLWTWIVQIGISICFEIFDPFSRNSLDPGREVQSTRSRLALNMGAEQESLQDNPGNWPLHDSSRCLYGWRS